MTDFAWYLLKVLLCSAILVGYYWLSLRNKKFHGYNRFYLLASVVLSWLIPLIKVDFWKGDLEQPQVIKLLAAVTSGNRYVEEAAFRNQFTWDWNIAALIAFVFISSVFFLRLTLSIVRIWLLISRNPAKKWNDIYFIFSNAKGTPFSFFKYIFWNEDINLNSFEGEQILKHELQHVHQKHSADKIFLNLAIIVGWYNPFLWLIRNELNLIHEFIADKQAINDGDTSAFAAMLLKATYPQHTFSLTNSFFYSPVKRRLLMLTSSKKTSYSYIRRLAILPLLSVVVLFFAFKLKDKNAVTRVVNLEKNYTVIIDVGPAGNNAGAIGIKGVNEKETALQLSKLVKAQNKNENIEIFLSGANNDHLTPGQRIELLVSKNADLLISLHVNTIPIKEKEKSGVLQREAPDVFVMYINKMSDNDDKILGSILSQNLQPVFKVAASVNKPQSGVYILDDANKICPSVLIECGFTAGEKDKQAEVSKGILKSIEEYFFYAEKKAINDDFQQQYLSVSNVDTFKAVPQFPGGALSWKKYLERNLDAAVGAKAGAPKGLYKVTIRFTVDKEGSISNINAITSNGYGFEDASINLIKKGPKWVPAKKDNLFIDAIAEQDFYFSVPVKFDSSKKKSFPGLVILDGKKMPLKEFRNNFEELGFNKTESRYNVFTIMSGKELEKYGEQGRNGVAIITTKSSLVNKEETVITDTPIQEKKYNKVFTKVENPPFYLNGMMAFADYINSNMQYPKEASTNKKEGAVLIQFIVSEEGKLTDFKKLSDKGYGLEEEAIRLIENSGEWKPGVQNGHKVPVQVQQQVIFELPIKV